MTAGRRSRRRERSTSVRQDSPPPGHFPSARAEPETARARRRLIVTATGIGGAGLLGISLSTKAGSPQFYLLTMGLAGTWAAGALSSGPLPLNMTQGREDAWRHPVVMPMLTGAGAFGLFYGAARLARHIPPLNRAIGSVLHYADDGSTPLVLATASANAVAEELFFRGALWSLVAESHPLVKTTLAYAATTAATRNPALVLAGTATSVLFGLQRRTSGGILAPALSHLTWSLLMLRYLPPLFPAPRPARDHSRLTARTVWQIAADSAPAPTQNQKICARQPMGPAQLSAAPIRQGSACIALTVAFRRRSLIVAMTGRSWATATASPSCTLTMVSWARGRRRYDRGHDRWLCREFCDRSYAG